MDKINKVLEAMKKEGKPVKAGELVELTNLSKTDIDNAMKQLKSGGKIISPKRCFWELK